MKDSDRGQQRAPGAEAIMSAALEAFSEHGYHGTSVRDIADRVGMSSAALYHHFPSKQDLLVTMMDRGIDELVRVSEDAVFSSPDDPATALAALVRVHVVAHTEDQKGSLVGNTEMRSLTEPGRTRIVLKRDRQQRLFDILIERGIKRGQFTTPYPVEAARAIVTMCTAVATWYRAAGPLTPAEIADRYAALALSMLGYQAPG